MKKVLLSSVAALAVFAAAAPVFANDGHVHTGSLDNKTEVTGPEFFTNSESGLTPEAKKGLDNVDAESTEAKFNENGEKLVPVPGKPGEFVVEGSAKDAKKEAKKEEGKAPAAAGQKTLPKTSAVK
ncbi:LPKTxAVK-anchored surface protein [Streptococcus xiaochunlingii]|uniref:Uncharacterized protein n=2 Tax=Streptococcus TaxID=1301 RepID=A0ABY2YBQ1_9STRE|nr:MULTISPECIES: LPKTxAVK-anchored surface protein [Streptococcus]MDK8387218.1 LPKTxAVK-anchored surface protein [Streptococcus xiaochunlingii]MDK8778950.1 LPKTxAVK-anchored surface protein [Streptococcus xiaochunlingii]TPE36426.1 hypothetical protein FJR71_08740 [Streptococcus xiaochunlingii]